MSLMLPSHNADSPRLADVVSSCIDSALGAPNKLGLPGVRHAIIVVVDGLGMHNLQSRKGHARTLASNLSAKQIARTTFPATTATALTTLLTGVQPGQHGVFGYSVVDPQTGTVLNQLTDWGQQMSPTTWQRCPTLFEAHSADGIAFNAIGRAKFADSGFSQAILRGAAYHSAQSIPERFKLAAKLADTPGVSYLYVSELDSIAHSRGWDSGDWIAQLEILDGALTELLKSVDDSVGVVVTADHGVIDIPAHRHIILNERFAAGFEHVAAVAGDPRVTTLSLQNGAQEQDRRKCATRWMDALGDAAWVFTREDALENGVFGPVAEELQTRIPDVFIAARKQVAFYDTRSGSPKSMSLVGQHGSFSDEEVRVPVLRFGGYC